MSFSINLLNFNFISRLKLIYAIMEKLDLDVFHARYIDVTLTPVTASKTKSKMPEEDNNLPYVELIPLTVNQESKFKEQLVTYDEALTCHNEYQELLTKLENVQKLTTPDDLASDSIEVGTSIADTYKKLLTSINEMRSNINPTVIGSRAAKDRLLRDIAQARHVVHECILDLMRN